MYLFFFSKHFRNYQKAKKISKKINSNEFLYDSAIINYLRKINPFVFEELLLYTFKKRGYKIYRNKRYTGDGGIDGKVKINRSLYYIQAKRYQSYINAKHVIDFNLLCERDNVHGFFMHTGQTGEGARLVNTKVQIISGYKLIQFLRYK